MTRYKVRSVGLASAARFGVTLGLIVGLLPGCAMGIVAVRGVAAIRQLLEGAAQARVTVLGQAVPVNLVEIARLGPALETLRALDALGWVLGFSAGTAFATGTALLAAVTALLAAVGYNALAAVSGGLALELDADRGPAPVPEPAPTIAPGQD